MNTLCDAAASDLRPVAAAAPSAEEPMELTEEVLVPVPAAASRAPDKKSSVRSNGHNTS